MTPLLAVVIAVAIAVIVLVVVARARSSRDGVDSFRRQIDALSPEARRPVVDQVQNAASRIEPRPVDDSEPVDAGDDADTTSPEPTDVAGADDESGDGDDTDGGSHGT